MKEFRVCVGMYKDHMTEVLSSTLKDDNVPETFTLRHTNSAGVPFPSRYIKIVPISCVYICLSYAKGTDTPRPLSAYSQSFHISIWFVSIAGFSGESYVHEVEQQHEAVRRRMIVPPVTLIDDAPQHKKAMALRHILKHLRSQSLMAAFKALSASADVQLEHPLVTQLYDSIVSDGNWAEAEHVLQLSADAGLFDAFARGAPAQAAWTRLCGASAGGDTPRQRGGHAMCIDEAADRIYLYGGWDGERSLDDFWVYSIAEGQWRIVPRHKDAIWPSRRSCHKMVFDAVTGRIFLLGCLGVSGDELRANDASGPSSGAGEPRAPAHRADFYAFHTRGDNAGTWELLSANTEVVKPFHNSPQCLNVFLGFRRASMDS
jgi:muskelin